MFYTYILESVHFADKTYIGFTNSIEERLKSHNHEKNKGYTARFKPWTVKFIFEFETKAEAMQKEKWLKSGVGRTWMKATIE